MLMIVSMLFVLTILGYLVGPIIEQRAIDGLGQRSPLAEWFDRKGVIALAIEFAVMCVLAVLAMMMDRHFAPAKTPPSKAER